MKGWIDVEVRDRDGRVIQKGRHEMHSFLNNLLRLFLGFFSAKGGAALSFSGAAASTTIVNTAGSSTSIYMEWYGVAYGKGGGCPICTAAPAGDGSYGIIVGTSSVSVSLDQYNLQGRIAQGTGEGQLDYREHLFDELGLDTGVTPPVYRWRLRRSIINSSGAAITINEVGLYARSYWKTTYYEVAQDVKYMLGRDVLPTSYTIPAGGSATVAVTVEVSLG